jgi:hypothetical protein
LVTAWGLFAPTLATAQEEQACQTIQIVTPDRVDGSIDVLCLDFLARLRSDDRMQKRLASGFRVYAQAAGQDVPMAGDYTILRDRLRFTPRFPLREAHDYAVSIDEVCFLEDAGSKCPHQTEPDTVFQIAAIRNSVARVTAVEPQADHLPANLLRFYVHFSEPMAQDDVYRHVSLHGADGTLAISPFLNLSRGLWDREQRRLTIMLDPGRIKRGAGPNLELGPLLVEGEVYILRIGPGLRDARGRPLPESF